MILKKFATFLEIDESQKCFSLMKDSVHVTMEEFFVSKQCEGG